MLYVLRPPRCVSTGHVVVRLAEMQINVNVNLQSVLCGNEMTNP